MGDPKQDEEHANLLLASRRQAQVLGEFLEWLEENGMAVCRGSGHHIGLGYDEWTCVTERTELLLARYFGVDMDAVERHRRRILDRLHEASDV